MQLTELYRTDAGFHVLLTYLLTRLTCISCTWELSVQVI